MVISTSAFASRRGVYTLRPLLPTLSKPSSSPKFLGMPLAPQVPTMGLVRTLSPSSSTSQVSSRPRQASSPSNPGVPSSPCIFKWQCPRGRCAAGGRVGCRTCGVQGPAASWEGWACSLACRAPGQDGDVPLSPCTHSVCAQSPLGVCHRAPGRAGAAGAEAAQGGSVPGTPEKEKYVRQGMSRTLCPNQRPPVETNPPQGPASGPLSQVVGVMGQVSSLGTFSSVMHSCVRLGLPGPKKPAWSIE